MEAETKLPAPQVKAKITNHMPSSIKDSPHPAPSSSLKTSSPDFLRHVQAAFKRRRPINSSQPSNLMPRRIMLPQRETPKNADNSLFLKAHETQEDASITPPSDSGTMTDTYEVNRNQKPFTTCKAGNSTETQEDASITPPSDLGTMTNKFQHIPLVEGSRKVCPSAESNSTSRETEWDNTNQAEPANMTHNEENLHVSQHLDVDRGLRSDGVSSSFGDRRSNLQDQLHHLQNFLHSDGTHPMTQSSVCATSISVHATSAPGPSLTTICSSHLEQPHGRMAQQSHLSANLSTTHNTNCATMVAQASTSGVPVDSMKETHQVPKERKVSKFSSICNQEPMKGTECAGAVLDAQSEGIPANSSSLDVKNEPSTREKRAKPETEKGGKPTRKKNYDPDMFFKVNGKLYQRLGKIGTGGSSEVHKVISSDCKIYALKKIKLKGRDYATAYGFCQEILYLNRLQGKNNIIQLIDYEVTDKALLEEVMKDSISNKDARVKDDGYIYMVLEYGEIDLAHMLSQKWKDMETSSETIDENWLRFYWQQILQAVNTIHEERIVHSDLKPANFLLVKGSLKLIDFGIAKSIMSDTTNIQRDAQVGTLSYMSPEAFMCNECDQNGNVIKCGRASDIWSLGCILYQMVYGRTPFADYKTFWAKFKVITDPNHEITYDAVSNPWLIDLMSKCLAWDRNKRWRIPELLQHPFLVPPAPTYVPSEPNQNYKAKAIQWIAESHANSKVSALCSQLQQLLAENPESREEQCELLTRILDVGSQLREQII